MRRKRSRNEKKAQEGVDIIIEHDLLLNDVTARTNDANRNLRLRVRSEPGDEIRWNLQLVPCHSTVLHECAAMICTTRKMMKCYPYSGDFLNSNISRELLFSSVNNELCVIKNSPEYGLDFISTSTRIHDLKYRSVGAISLTARRITLCQR